MRALFLAAIPVLLLCAPPASASGHAAASRRVIRAIALSPDGRRVALIERADGASADAPSTVLTIRDLRDGTRAVVPLPCDARDCVPSSPAWSRDGQRVAFLVAHDDGLAGDVDVVGPDGTAPRVLARFAGPLDDLRVGPGDQLAVLATARARKRVGRTQTGARLVGDIGTIAPDEQRIAVVAGDALRFVSPPDLYVYEYDWRPDGGFVGTAAPGDGDSQWWIARLLAFDAGGRTRLLFAPPPEEQLASPRVSPDGRMVAFIGGWMSDFGSTGGDAFLLPLAAGDGAASALTPRDLTGRSARTVTALTWSCGEGLTGVSLAGDRVVVERLDAPASSAGGPLWSGRAAISSGGWNLGLACVPGRVAAAMQDFATAPALVTAPITSHRIGAWRRPAADGTDDPAVEGSAPVSARSLSWSSDGFTVQGWLLAPTTPLPAGRKRPLVVVVHGGPQAAAVPEFVGPHDLVHALLAQGWDVLEPNYRGSFGQGERFARASIRDIGGGDWRDVIAGVDAAERAAPIDDGRLGITGGSYGGYMAMWAVTQTHRFKAAVADAGVSDWLSIEGTAPQAGSDAVTFGGSVYDDATPYLRASPVTHMKGVDTPALAIVGERDEECPAEQSLEFYTALRALGVPADLHVYPDEGHGLTKEADRTDARDRTVAWFRRYFGPDQATR